MRKTFFHFFISSLISLSAIAAPSKKVIHLTHPTVIDGIPVKAGDIEIFIPNGELAYGVLSQEHIVQTLLFPSDTELRMKEPHTLESVVLPKAEVIWLLNIPFRDSSTITFQYDSNRNRFKGLVAKSPTQFTNFPTGQINPAILENDVSVQCSQYSGPHFSSVRWFCDFSVTLEQSQNQNFGIQTVQLPEKSTLHFDKWGMNVLKLPQDSILLGLPVSHLKPIRINRWTSSGPSVIVGMTLSEDSEYDGLPLSKTGEVEFYDPDSSGLSKVSSFVPSTDTVLKAASQPVTIKALTRGHLNRDQSIRYAALATEQVIEGILFPKDALVFFGSSASSRISSVGLFPKSRATIDGITYINDMGAGTLFLDFDQSGKVYQVRKVNP